MKLVVLAAGKGTRFLPLTQTIPKGLIQLVDKPLLEHVLEPYLNHVSEIIFIINDDLGYKIKEHFGENYKGHPITYTIQKSGDLKGTYFALSLAKEYLAKNELFCVCNCDDLIREKDIRIAVESKVPGIGITRATMPWNYLSIDLDAQGFVSGFRRHQKDDGLVITDHFSNGFHILSPEIFDFTPVQTRDGELGLPQTLFENLTSYPLKGFIFKEWQAVNGPDELDAANKFIELNT